MAYSETTDRHANARDRKRNNQRKMVVTNRSIFTIQEMLGKRAKDNKRDKKNSRNRKAYTVEE